MSHPAITEGVCFVRKKTKCIKLANAGKTLKALSMCVKSLQQCVAGQEGREDPPQSEP